jgi:dienelactone hydrolase
MSRTTIRTFVIRTAALLLAPLAELTCCLPRPNSSRFIACLIAALAIQTAMADESEKTFLDFVKSRAAELHARDETPASLDDWQKRRGAIRMQLLKAWGGFPEKPCPLNPQILGTLQRDGYRVEKVIFQTMPDVWMTANAYVPDRPGKLATVLCVHGHWPDAKQDPNVQARCIGLAKLGFFVLAVDAFGAGERGVGKALGEYHGEMVAATLWPIGRPLSGLQVYENQRAVDYLLTRPEVDGARLGVTGASGGGNQTMYAGAWDERFKAVVPVCSVGNYQAYLGAACCMCEVVPGAIEFTEEWGVLSLTAPRALMVINATRDAFQFSVGEAKKSLSLVEPVYRLYGQPENVRHTIFESPHAYNGPMREGMYGWMTRHLKGEGDGSPISEPEMDMEEPETLRCFPGESRADDWMTIPKFAAREGRKLSRAIRVPTSAATWREIADSLKGRLDQDVLRGTETKPRPPGKSAFPKRPTFDVPPAETFAFKAEPGIRLTATQTVGKAPQRAGTVIVLSLEGEAKPAANEMAMAVHQSGRTVVSLSLRATGAHAYPRDKIGRAPDHNTAEWSLWLGRPLLGQWVLDLRAALNAIEADAGLPRELTVVGVGPAGVVALCASALDSRIQQVVTVGSLASYVSDAPYENQRLGIMAPGIVRYVGDIQHLAALIAPRKLVIVGGVNGAGQTLGEAALKQQFDFTQRVYSLEQAAIQLTVLPSIDVADIVRKLN